MFNEIAKELWKTKISKGFVSSKWDKPETVASKIALIHSELSEALEEVRNQDQNAFCFELIDVLIRTLELLHETHADIDLFFSEKTKKNRERESIYMAKRLHYRQVCASCGSFDVEWKGSENNSTKWHCNNCKDFVKVKTKKVFKYV